MKNISTYRKREIKCLDNLIFSFLSFKKLCEKNNFKMRRVPDFELIGD